MSRRMGISAAIVHRVKNTTGHDKQRKIKTENGNNEKRKKNYSYSCQFLSCRSRFYILLLSSLVSVGFFFWFALFFFMCFSILLSPWFSSCSMLLSLRSTCKQEMRTVARKITSWILFIMIIITVVIIIIKRRSSLLAYSARSSIHKVPSVYGGRTLSLSFCVCVCVCVLFMYVSDVIWCVLR